MSAWKLTLSNLGLASVALIVAAAMTAPFVAPAGAETVGRELTGTITIGRTTRDVALEERRWQMLMAHLNRDARAQNHPPIELHVTSSTTGLLWDLWDQKIDVFIGNPFFAAGLIREAGALPLLVIEESEPSLERSVIVVREADDAIDWTDLNDRQLAFSRHGSDLVHLLPRSTLLQKGMTVVERGQEAALLPGQVAAFHIPNDRSPLVWLYRSAGEGKAAAASMRDFQAIERQRPELFRPILVSPPIPVAIAITSAEMEPGVAVALAEHFRLESAMLFDALGMDRRVHARLRPATSNDPAILDLLERVRLIEAAAASR